MRDLLGLGDNGSDTQNRRRLLLPSYRRRAKLRVVANLAIAAITTLVISVPLHLVGGWLTIVVVFHLWSYEALRKIQAEDVETSYVREFRANSLHAFVSALLWSIPFGFQGMFPTLDHVLLLWGMLLLQMMFLAMLGYYVPAVCALFMIPVSLVASWAFVAADDLVLALIAFSVGILFSLACLRFANIHAMFQSARATLHEKNETVSLLLREHEENKADWLWQTDFSQRLVHVSPQFAAALGSTPEALEGRLFPHLLSGGACETGSLPPILSEMAEAMEHYRSFSNLVVPVVIVDGLDNGKSGWWELSASPRLDGRGNHLGFRGVGSDVTEKRISAEQNAKMVRSDTLTGIPNRLLLNETLEKVLKETHFSRTCALLMIDLDRFKAVNDSFGHPVGDKLLVQVSERIKNLIGGDTPGDTPGDTLCARLGGDEFAIVMSRIFSPGDAEALGESLITLLRHPFVVDSHHLFIGASVGFAIGPTEGSSVEELTRNADLALYKSKERGGNVVVRYEAAFHAEAEDLRIMTQDLYGALSRGEFDLHYQPIVETNSGTLDGFEALIRWENEKLSPILSSRFLSLTGDAHLIGSIGEWTLCTACHEAMRWPSYLSVAVSVSSEQLIDPEFPHVVASALRQSGLAAKRLEIEISEDIFRRCGDSVSHLLAPLLSLGVRLGLDGFGMGDFSFGYLRTARFSTIRTGLGFVQSATQRSPESIAIIRAAMALSDSLGMATMAVGVENEAEAEAIRKFGFSKAQGGYFGGAMPHEEVMNFLDQTPPRNTDKFLSNAA